MEDDGDDGGISGVTRGLATGRLNPKDIIHNMSNAVSSKLAVGKLAVQIDRCYQAVYDQPNGCSQS